MNKPNKTNKPITIMLVEDNPVYRNVVNRALVRDAGMNLINSVGTAERALSYLQGVSGSECPDLILLDISLPGMSGLDALPVFQKVAPQSKVVILTQSENESDVLRAISLGASGYLLKSSTVNQIKECIQTVMEGGASLGPAVAKFILSTFQSKLTQSELENALSERELEILRMLGDGKVKKEIADALDISFFTVASHLRNIYMKLHVQNAPAAIAKAYQTGLFKA
jgi:DNA-binding NarL/FixJ family response regulator